MLSKPKLVRQNAINYETIPENVSFPQTDYFLPQEQQQESLIFGQYPITNCDIKNVKSLIVTFRDGMSYDDTTYIYSKGRYTTLIQFSDAKALLELLLNVDNDIKHENKDFCDILSIIKQIGFQQTTFNFECCSGCTQTCYNVSEDSKLTEHHSRHFRNEETTTHIVSLVDYLLTKGSCVMFADFSFKSLIQNWNNENWGECPFRNISTMCGLLNITYPLDETKKSQFGQLAQIASMAIPDKKTNTEEVSSFSMTVKSLPGTLVYDIKEEIDSNITLYVHSVMSNTQNITCEYNPSVAHGSHAISGLPIHTVVNFQNRPGLMVVSNIHFKELVDIDANVDTVLQKATNVLGRQRTDEMEQQLSKSKCPKLKRALTSSYVAEITSGSNPINRPVVVKRAKTEL